ncbi:MAG: phenylacetate-CoA oxygenase subunit PaaC [Bacteroidia bacterium]|nr:phenylacetate-CoA oxygenase subunit PaaC [Bacteroidia bacterium]
MENQTALFQYCLRLADSNLILSHRLSEWCGHGPILEEDIALINIALDFIGHGTALLQYAALVEGKGRSEDDLAYMRNEREYRNALLVEQPNGDYAKTIARQFLFDTFQYHFYQALQNSKDETLAALAAKALKEITYHLRHSSQWVLRMGDGTDESHSRIQTAFDDLWMFTGDLFDMDTTDETLLKQGIAVDLAPVKEKWQTQVSEVLQQATLKIPDQTFMQGGSRDGRHTEHLGYLLAEMQYLPRTYPGAKW